MRRAGGIHARVDSGSGESSSSPARFPASRSSSPERPGGPMAPGEEQLDGPPEPEGLGVISNGPIVTRAYVDSEASTGLTASSAGGPVAAEPRGEGRQARIERRCPGRGCERRSCASWPSSRMAGHLRTCLMSRKLRRCAWQPCRSMRWHLSTCLTSRKPRRCALPPSNGSGAHSGMCLGVRFCGWRRSWPAWKQSTRIHWPAQGGWPGISIKRARW